MEKKRKWNNWKIYNDDVKISIKIDKDFYKRRGKNFVRNCVIVQILKLFDLIK